MIEHFIHIFNSYTTHRAHMIYVPQEPTHIPGARIEVGSTLLSRNTWILPNKVMPNTFQQSPTRTVQKCQLNNSAQQSALFIQSTETIHMYVWM